MIIWARLLAFVTGLVNQELLLQNEYLAAVVEVTPKSHRRIEILRKRY
jgi:hypothetical protein